MVDNIKDIKDKFSGFTPYINGYQNMKRASVLIPKNGCIMRFE